MSGSVPRTGTVSVSSAVAEADGLLVLLLGLDVLLGADVPLGDAVLPGDAVLGVGRIELGS